MTTVWFGLGCFVLGGIIGGVVAACPFLYFAYVIYKMEEDHPDVYVPGSKHRQKWHRDDGYVGMPYRKGD